MGGFLTAMIVFGITSNHKKTSDGGVDLVMLTSIAVADPEEGDCDGYPNSFLCMYDLNYWCCEEPYWGYLGERWEGF